MDTIVGKVTHYYDKIGVAVFELVNELSVGDRVRFIRGGEDLFEQEISSIQIEHEKVENATAGQVVGIKVEQELKDGTEVYKITEE